MARATATFAAAVLIALVALGSAHATDHTGVDIREIDVRLAEAGAIEFQIRYAEPVELPRSTVIDIFIDADGDRSTGDEGFEYAIDYSRGIDGRPYASVFRGVHERRAAGLEFAHAGASSTFTVPAGALGFPRSFTYSFSFYVVMEVGGELADAAPTHVLVSSSAQPFDVEASDLLAGTTLTYQDLADGTPAEDPAMLLYVAGAVLAFGAVLALVGWSVERVRTRAPGRIRRPPGGDPGRS